MKFILKKNTHRGGMNLHTVHGYAFCPFTKDKAPCGTWCALFRVNEDRKSIHQLCGKSITTTFLTEETDEKTFKV